MWGKMWTEEEPRGTKRGISSEIKLSRLFGGLDLVGYGSFIYLAVMSCCGVKYGALELTFAVRPYRGHGAGIGMSLAALPVLARHTRFPTCCAVKTLTNCKPWTDVTWAIQTNVVVDAPWIPTQTPLA